MNFLLIALLTFVFVISIHSMPVNGALYWNAGVRAKEISVCFVGDALTSRPNRVQQVLNFIKEYEYAANIKFKYLGTCPVAKVQSNGNDYFDGDIRVALPSTTYNGNPNFALGQIPGKGCPKTDGNTGWGSWSNPPNDLPNKRACLYNLKLGDDPWNSTPYLNHTLHEFGHALGLSHEHERKDATCYNPKQDPRWTDQGYMTAYDTQSVMHYAFSLAGGATCDIIGNYGFTGLSASDKLAAHILYPEDNHVAEYVGTTVVRTTDKLNLQSTWKARGANMDFVAKNFVWKLAGSVVSTTPDLSITLNNPGDYPLELTYKDFLDRSYSYTKKVRVFVSETYNHQIAAPIAAKAPLL
ncbi:hypothetical protein DA73_0400000240 [Tolypothrix bouteillei VB521301]|uniref:Peptidase M12A domain-containing protein n=1 Tax=Tolypothrix bouteillei VB521301 TaxID=1479485 RepID=A0A8S9TFH7_9CYAN|nr:hypothetical protein DA73_0400000240 [Tolypothrix bouteillei VB521301]